MKCFKMLTVWIAIFFLFTLIEAGSPGLFFFLSIACGALGGFVCDFYATSGEVQIGFFCIVTIISFCLLRLLTLKIQSQVGYKSSIEKLKGSIVPLLTDCNTTPGTVHIAGTTWSVQSSHGEHINAGVVVRIIDIKNTTLIIQPIRKTGGNNV